MLAEDFGYQVSPRPAGEMTPEVRTDVASLLEVKKQWVEKQEPGGAYVGGLFLIIGGFVFAITTQTLPILLVAIALALAIGHSAEKNSGQAKEELADFERVSTAAVASPWQAWPCRVQEIAGVGDKAVLLLGPEGEVACTYQSPMPEDVWTGLTDGRGVVWFAGDVRFGGLLALPGGHPRWWARIPKVEITPRPISDRQLHIEEELTRQAVAYVFSEWL
ncbi:hypothetical protein OG322_40420 [Streptomyces sp. NBC_01260]|uniref:hypothetical protein n=1 Tax=Streptomyces sp. NBC_01260 TaxID=2903801 RepID=UPI002E38202A|nr:hypothetical protein [Streptomyces sp. NBC_01260]